MTPSALPAEWNFTWWELTLLQVYRVCAWGFVAVLVLLLIGAILPIKMIDAMRRPTKPTGRTDRSPRNGSSW